MLAYPIPLEDDDGTLPQVDRILDVHHNSRMDQVDAAMGAIGRHLYVKASARR